MKKLFHQKVHKCSILSRRNHQIAITGTIKLSKDLIAAHHLMTDQIYGESPSPGCFRGGEGSFISSIQNKTQHKVLVFFLCLGGPWVGHRAPFTRPALSRLKTTKTCSSRPPMRLASETSTSSPALLQPFGLIRCLCLLPREPRGTQDNEHINVQ